MFESQQTLYLVETVCRWKLPAAFTKYNMKLRAKLDELKLKYEQWEKIEVPILKKMCGVLPLDMTASEERPAASANGDILDSHFWERKNPLLIA